MNLIIDTNIVIKYIRENAKFNLSEFVFKNDTIFIPVVTLGEINSLSIQNKWGKNRMLRLNYFFENVNVIDVTEMLTPLYSTIDAYSQRRHPSFENYTFPTPRNMGKNDLWIAATAAFLNLKLLTSDSDFDHLNDVFLNVEILK